MISDEQNQQYKQQLRDMTNIVPEKFQKRLFK